MSDEQARPMSTEPLDDAALAEMERDGLWEVAEDRRIASLMRVKRGADTLNRRADVTEHLVAALRAERAKTQRVRELADAVENRMMATAEPSEIRAALEGGTDEK